MLSRKEKIAIVDSSVSFTGAFKCALMEAELLKDDFDFVFIVPDHSSVVTFLEQKGLPYYTLPMLEISKSPKNLLLYFPRLLANAKRLRGILQREEVALVQVNDFYNLLGAAVRGLGYKGKLITYVRFLPSVMPGPLRRLWTGVAQKYGDAVVAVSKAVWQQLPRHENTVCIYDAVVLPERWPAKEWINDEPVRFLYLANYIRGKGQDHALAAFKEAIKEQGSMCLRFVGGDMGLEKNKSFKRELEAFVQKHQLEGAVTFESFEPDIEKVIKAADVVLNLSEAESFSMTCAEASYYGVPVIASRCGGPEEIIQHQRTGMLVENGNREQMRTAILQLAQSPELRKAWGRAARVSMQEHFSAERYRENFLALLKRIGLSGS